MTAAVGYKGAEYTNYTSDPVVRNSAATTWGGSIKRYYFSFTATVALIAANSDYVEVLPLKAGQRLFGGMISTDDANGDATVGNASSATAYSGTLAIHGDAPKAFGNTIAKNLGLLLTADEVLRLTAITADIDIGKKYVGYIDVMETVP